MHMTLSKPQIDLLVTDLDNTLWNWFEMWHVSFEALVVALSDQSGIDRDVLEGEMRQVHQSRGTTEYSFLVDELPSLIAVPGSQKPSVRFNDAIHQQKFTPEKDPLLVSRGSRHAPRYSIEGSARRCVHRVDLLLD